MYGRVVILCFFLLVGCTEPSAPPQEAESTTTELGQAFDTNLTGTIHGRVTWDGDVPAGEEFIVRTNAFNPYLHRNPGRFRTPHLPQVDAKSRGVANAVVFLRGIEPSRSKKWDHPPVRVEYHERQLIVVQGESKSQVGFVRRGAAIEIVNRDPEYHSLRVRGAAFLALPLIDGNRVHERNLKQAGLVDLTCGAGYYWLHAHLFVVDHPYYARTDAEGRFRFDHVPAGKYDVVCWLPSWHVERKEYDPETAIIARWVWHAPQELKSAVTVETGDDREVTFRWNASMFD